MRNSDILFTPFHVGNVEIPNRIVETAVTGTSLFYQGRFNEPTRDFYLERAQGGAGLIITGAAMVMDIFGREYDLDQCGDVFDGPIRSLVSEVHDAGSKFFLQIGVGLGRVVGLKPFGTLEGANLDKVRVASSRLPNVWDPSIIHEEISVDEIRRRTEITIWTAKKARDCGFDGVEIHAVHEGYLLDQFAIANMNKRRDQYGGTLQNRLRFTTDIISGIKAVCGDFPVSVRYSVVSKMKGLNEGALPGETFTEFGRDYEESIQVAQLLQEAGCDMLNADNGTYDSWYWAHPPVYMDKACNLDDCAFLREHVQIPVVCAGRMEDPQVAASAISEKGIDGIGVARQFLADPKWVNKLRQGHQEDIRPCIACHNGCLGRLLEGEGMSCALNPACMQEQKYVITKAPKAKRILVIGGGIGGMEAARLCRLRGHDVILCEKTSELGGAFIAAAALSYKEADRNLIQWYRRQMELTGVDVRLNTEVDVGLIEKVKADHIILATGAVPKAIPVKGIDQEHVVEVKDWLLKKKPAGKKVAIIGGGLSGCEVAYEMAMQGHDVTIIEMQEDILKVKNLSAANSSMLRDLLRSYGVKIYTNTQIVEVQPKSINIQERKAAEDIQPIVTIPCDTVILAAGYKPMAFDEGTNYQSNIHVIGDAASPGNLMNAIWSAYDAALQI